MVFGIKHLSKDKKDEITTSTSVAPNTTTTSETPKENKKPKEDPKKEETGSESENQSTSGSESGGVSGGGSDAGTSSGSGSGSETGTTSTPSTYVAPKPSATPSPTPLSSNPPSEKPQAVAETVEKPKDPKTITQIKVRKTVKKSNSTVDRNIKEYNVLKDERHCNSDGKTIKRVRTDYYFPVAGNENFSIQNSAIPESATLKMKTESTYEYDDNGKLNSKNFVIQEYKTAETKQLNHKTNYEYDNVNNLIKKKKYNQENNATINTIEPFESEEFIYEQKNDKYVLMRKNVNKMGLNNPNKHSVIKYEYDENGNKKSEITKASPLYSKLDYTYNDSHQLIKKSISTKTPPTNQLKENRVYEHKYNEKGLLKESIRYMTANPNKKVITVYNYDNNQENPTLTSKTHYETDQSNQEKEVGNHSFQDELKPFEQFVCFENNQPTN